MSDSHNRKAIRELYKDAGGYDGRFRERKIANKKQFDKYPHRIEDEIDEYYEDLEDEVDDANTDTRTED